MNFSKRKILIFLFLLFFLSFFSFALVQGSYDYCQKDGKDCTFTDPSTCVVNGCAWDSTLGICALPLGADWPSSPLGTSISRCTNITGLIKYFYDWAITLGGLLTFIGLLIAGFEYLSSVGEPTKMTAAKNRIYSALLGLILLLSSWLILNTINPQLTKFKAELQVAVLSPPEIETGIGISGTPCSFAKIYNKENCDSSEGSSIITPSDEPISTANWLVYWVGANKGIRSYIMYKKRGLTGTKCALPDGYNDTIHPYPTSTAYNVTTTFTYITTVGTTKYYKADEKEGGTTIIGKYICGGESPDYKYYKLESCENGSSDCSQYKCIYANSVCPPSGFSLPSGIECVTTTDVSEGFYITGGACYFAVFQPGGWFGTGCGEKFLIAKSYANYIGDYLPGDIKPEDIKCAQLVRPEEQ